MCVTVHLHHTSYAHESGLLSVIKVAMGYTASRPSRNPSTARARGPAPGPAMRSRRGTGAAADAERGFERTVREFGHGTHVVPWAALLPVVDFNTVIPT
ncbi:hypothetical protein DL766_004539 [Monosporascus sp. MC13-8B]|uniref:Uncharacterized protein n=1 Tax=Monosporascus cannonballus TaxID=155416 RepID=A0ABY0HIE6_9PEZI|nr:hypothetical protein DL763_005727 [Monosporascus cannonballus]RYO94157.1 hypothetical protein DL762_000667 [Monosporascus cannonballus]RYP31109.1 hypothetical protein DL766_004539 [Monosporascus sp. MC13-8B]